MDIEPERHLIESKDPDPIVFAYRISNFKASRGIVRVRRSELAKDRNLVEIPRSKRSPDFDPRKSLEEIGKNRFREADPYVERKIQLALVSEEVKRRAKKRKVAVDSLAKNLSGIKSLHTFSAQQVLALVTYDLKEKGLWRDEDQDLTMTEAFPLSQAKADPRYSADDLKALEHGTFLTEEEITQEEISTETSSSENPIYAGLLRLPELATPMINNVMRASPKDLYHQIARRMIDSHFFEAKLDDHHLYPACYFASKGVEDEEHFNALMQAGLNKRFEHYTFETFRVERLSLRRRIRVLIEEFFSNSFTIKTALLQRPEPEKQDPKKIWTRFFDVWNSLTLKQKNTLQTVYMDQYRLTKKEAAAKFGIKFDSIRDRLKTAIRKFKSEFWELDGVSPKRLPKRKLRGALTHNGLWRYQTAAWKSPLFGVDPEHNVRMEIEWHKLPKKKRLSLQEVARIKAQIIENCPVPYFYDTEYFDGMKPTIMSFGRRPGNLENESETLFEFDEES